MTTVAPRFSLPHALLTLLAALIAATCPGCVAGLAAVGGAGAVAYAAGDVQRTYVYPMDVVWNASLDALAASEVPVTDWAKDQLKARIEARTATGDKIKIELANQGGATSLNIRVNTFGNKQTSSAILREIDRRLNHS